MTLLPILYKKTSTGAIQQWSIGIMGAEDLSPEVKIVTVHGQVDGKLQRTEDVISKGKNTGKKNATTPEQQAHAEAQAKWEKQKKKGYVETFEAAQAGEVDEIIEGGIVPMLAHKYSEHAHKIKYPCYVQPKLDGIRCIAVVKDGQCTLWTRTRKQITSMPHIVQELEAAFQDMDITLDGELYNHDFKSQFEKIVSMVRQDEPDPEHHNVQYHVYDVVNSLLFGHRFEGMKPLFSMFEFFSIKLVDTQKCNTEDDVMVFFDRYRAQGYEGAMLRNNGSLYVNKRSYDLQKVKEFDDAEFSIVGVEEGRGKLAGHAIFVCKTDQGKEFLAKMKGDTSRLKDYFENHTLWKGKKLTVKYQGLTNKEQVPRFPVGVEIRDYE